MNTWLILPIKPFSLGKSRLATVLDEPSRVALNRALMIHVLQTALATERFEGIVVVSRDPTAQEIANAYGVSSLAECGYGLNQALLQGRTYVMRKQRDEMQGALLVLPTDLPLLTVDDLHLVLDASENSPSVVIAPSPDGGTNALLTHPVDAIPFRFGRNSFKYHCSSARRANLPLRQVSSPGLQTDIDMPNDLLHLPSSILSVITHDISSPQA